MHLVQVPWQDMVNNQDDPLRELAWNLAKHGAGLTSLAVRELAFREGLSEEDFLTRVRLYRDQALDVQDKQKDEESYGNG